MSETLELDKSVPVLIVKVGRYVIHHGAVAVARSLGRLGVPVHAIVEDRCTPLALSRYVQRTFRWPDGALDRNSVVNALNRISQQLGTRAILLPTDDAAAVMIAESQADLADAFIFPRVESGLTRRLCNKRELYLLCRSAGVPCPVTAFPQSLDDVDEFIDTAVFPLFVKAADARLLPSGAPKTSIAHDADELISLYGRAQNPICPNLLLQEYIPRGSEDWVFHGYRSREGGSLAAFTGRKVRSWPPFAGPTTLGVSERNEALIAQTEALLMTINFVGILDLDYRYDTRDAQYKLLDFNPRVGANFRMFEDYRHLDVVRAMHLDLTGRPVQQVSMCEGHKFLVESYDFFTSVSYMRHDGLTLKSWWSSLSGKTEMAWFHRDDPAPFVAMWLRLFSRKAGGAFRHSLLRHSHLEAAPQPPVSLENQPRVDPSVLSNGSLPDPPRVEADVTKPRVA